MPSSKNANTFASFQEQKQVRREKYIEAYLVVARKSRQKYDFVTDLAKAVANHISVNEKREHISESECNPSTLLRNNRYKSLLLSYLADSASAGLKNSHKLAIKLSPAEKSSALLSDIKTSNLRLESQRLKYHIADLEKALAAKGEIQAIVSKSGSANDALVEFSEMEFKYVSTCQVVMAIVSKLQDVLTVDIEKRRILDAAVRRGDNVIVDERLAAPFFDWLKKHDAGGT